MPTRARSARATAMVSTAVVMAGLVAGVGLAACSDDEDADPPGTGSAVTETSVRGDGGDPDGAATTMTGAQICERLSAQAVANDLGVDVSLAEPADAETPQCHYLYASPSGGRSNVTVAAMRPADVGGATGQAAFDALVQINEAIAGDDAERQDIDAGDGAVRMSGAALHVGILRLGDHVYTLLVPAGDADADAVDRLIATMATTLAA